MRPEAKVGLFIVVGLLALFALSTRVQTVANFGKAGYRVYAEIPSATGLEDNTVVRINGVQAGFIEKMEVRRGQVRLTLFIFKGNDIAEDSLMVVAQEGLLNGNHINIVYGNSETLLKDGDFIRQHKLHASLDEAIDEIRTFVANLNTTFDGETRSNLQGAIAEFKTMAERLSAAGEEFRIVGNTVNERLPKIMAQIDDLTAEFKQTGADINAKLPEILEKFSRLEDDLLALVDENRKPLNETIHSVNTFFKKGSDTLESIDNLVSKADKAELQVDLFYNRMLKDGYGESAFGVAYLPNPSSYYMLDVVSVPDLTRTDPATGDVILPKLHDEGEWAVSAQVGKRYAAWLLRAGLIRSTGGVGVDYFSKDDRLKLSLEAYDFNAVNDIRGKNPHTRFQARYLPWKHVAFYGGYDNFLNADAANFFAGAGVHFVDDDLKYLILSTGSSMAK